MAAARSPGPGTLPRHPSTLQGPCQRSHSATIAPSARNHSGIPNRPPRWDVYVAATMGCTYPYGTPMSHSFGPGERSARHRSALSNNERSRKLASGLPSVARSLASAKAAGLCPDHLRLSELKLTRRVGPLQESSSFARSMPAGLLRNRDSFACSMAPLRGWAGCLGVGGVPPGGLSVVVLSSSPLLREHGVSWGVVLTPASAVAVVTAGEGASPPPWFFESSLGLRSRARPYPTLSGHGSVYPQARTSSRHAAASGVSLMGPPTSCQRLEASQTS